MKEILFFGYIFLFLLGVSVGSFINAFEYRLKRGLDVVSDRSKCTTCGHELGILDLVPILSFLFIRGRCRYCKTGVSWQYPIVEFIAGLLFLLSGQYVYATLHSLGDFSILTFMPFSILFGLFFCFFLFIALYDVKHQIVSNKVIIPTIVVAFGVNIVIAVTMHLSDNRIINVMFSDHHLAWNTLSGLIGGLSIAFIIIATKGKGMGGGDLKLLVFMGLVLGPINVLLASYIAVISGAVGGIMWGLKKGRIKGLKIPFALFLSIGSIIAYVWGDTIIESYVFWL